MAPPLTLTRSMSGWCSFSQARTTDAKASLISTRSMSARRILARSSTFEVAGIGPVSMVTGSTPARANEWNRARGVRPRLVARSSLMMSTAAAPSVICDELPAVTLPSSFLKAGLSWASVSTVVSGRMPSSVSTMSPVSLPSSSFSTTGTISRWKRPSAVARAARCWLVAPKRSRSSRDSPHLSAMSSAEMPWGTSPPTEA